jgi:methyl-accepting chemotaxis protein WspA
MKKMTFLQRLNTTLMVLIIALGAGVGLGFWMAQGRIDQLTAAKNGIDCDVALVSDGLRGVLLDPRKYAGGESERPRAGDALAEADKKRSREGEADLKKNIGTIRSSFGTFSELRSALDGVQAFAIGTNSVLAGFQNRMETLRGEAAAAYYCTNYPALSRQRDKALGEVADQVGKVIVRETERALTMARTGIASIILLLAASIFVSFKQSSAITEPLNRLVTAMERLRQGDFTQRLGLDRKDEFGVLGEGLNRLADDLSGLVGQVQRSGIQVNTTATEIAASAKEQQSTAHEIAATTAQIGATSKEISATSKELVKTMNEVNQVAEETANVAGSGQTAIARMEATMRQIVEASGSVTAKLAVLSEKTANINSVVTTITKVADQTNLLSLNAAIEAEKAGEYGLGFAVVAMEIRRLADQTAVATYDIEKMVKEMQSAVAAGVMGMDKFSEEARHGVEEIRQVSTHLAQIIHQVQTLTPRFQTVNEGMHAQATGAQQISETLTQLSEAAQQTAESLRQSNQAIEQLNGAARGLQTSVARFKLAT